MIDKKSLYYLLLNYHYTKNPNIAFLIHKQLPLTNPNSYLYYLRSHYKGNDALYGSFNEKEKDFIQDFATNFPDNILMENVTVNDLWNKAIQ